MTQVIESNRISDVLHHADEKTLVIFDVDNTLIMPETHVGGSAWFMHMIQMFCDKGLSEQEAIEKVYEFFVQLQHFIPIKMVEYDTADVIQKLHARAVKTLGLTGRGFSLSRQTVAQLQSVNISIGTNTIHDKEIVFNARVGFFNGILSLNADGDKGECLIALFEKIDYWPERVVFVDDLRYYIDDVYNVLVPRKIPFIGIRYGAADEQHIKFDPARADDELRRLLAGTEYHNVVKEILG